MKKQFFKFLIVGGLNTVFGYGLFALFLFFRFHYSLAVLFATVLGVFFNFFTIGKLVFLNSKHQLIWKFIGVYIIVYVLNVSGLWIFEQLMFNLYIAGALLVLPLAVVSFILNKYWVFTTNQGML